MDEERIILSVEQFIHRKGYDILFNALCQIDKAIGCYIVVGKPTEEFLQMVQVNQLTNVYFVNFKLRDELNEYYRTTDLFVLPAREDIWELVINEAMVRGMPVIATNRYVEGLELIQKSALGLLVSAEDSEALANAILKEIENMSEERADHVLRKNKTYTVEQMARVHLKYLERIYESDKQK